MATMTEFTFRSAADFGQDPLPAEEAPPPRPVRGNPYVGRLAVGTEAIVSELMDLCGPDDEVVHAGGFLVYPLMYRRALPPIQRGLAIAEAITRGLMSNPSVAGLIEASLGGPDIKKQADNPLLSVRLLIADTPSSEELQQEWRRVRRGLPSNVPRPASHIAAMRVIETPSAAFAQSVYERLAPLVMSGVELDFPNVHYAPPKTS